MFQASFIFVAFILELLCINHLPVIYLCCRHTMKCSGVFWLLAWFTLRICLHFFLMYVHTLFDGYGSRYSLYMHGEQWKWHSYRLENFSLDCFYLIFYTACLCRSKIWNPCLPCITFTRNASWKKTIWHLVPFASWNICFRGVFLYPLSV